MQIWYILTYFLSKSVSHLFLFFSWVLSLFSLFLTLLHITVILSLVSKWHVCSLVTSNPFSASKNFVLSSSTSCSNSFSGLVIHKCSLQILKAPTMVPVQFVFQYTHNLCCNIYFLTYCKLFPFFCNIRIAVKFSFTLQQNLVCTKLQFLCH